MDGSTPIIQPGRIHDEDPVETGEWLDSLAAVIEGSGPDRGKFLVHRLVDALRQIGAGDSTQQFSAYRNTIPSAMALPMTKACSPGRLPAAPSRWGGMRGLLNCCSRRTPSG